MDNIDARGLSCPQPVLLVKNALDARKEGELRVLTDPGASPENIRRLAKNMDWSVEIRETEEGMLLTLTK